MELLGRRILGPIGEKDYTYDQKFPIILPSRVYPSNSVIIVTENNPKGEITPIHWVGLDTPPSVQDLGAEAQGSATTQDSATTLNKPEETRFEVLGKEFTLKQSATVPSHGFLHMDYDKNMLELVTANIEDKDIVWTFKSIQPGSTPIVLVGSMGHALSLWRVQVDIYIIQPLGPEGKSDDDQTNGLQAVASAQQPDANWFLHFRGRIFEAQRIVQKSYPEAQLRVAEADLPGALPPTTSALMLTKLRAVFVSQQKSCTITMKSTGGRIPHWLPPVVSPGGIVGVADMDIMKLKVELEDAAMKAPKPFFNATLSYMVLSPEYDPKEPRYAFKLMDGSVFYVGAMTGKVSNDVSGLGLITADGQ